MKTFEYIPKWSMQDHFHHKTRRVQVISGMTCAFLRLHGPAHARGNRSVDSDLTRNLFHKT